MKSSDPSREEEKRLVILARSGDREAFRELVEKYQDRAFSVTYGKVRDREDAKEIVQEAFVKTWFSLKNFRGDSSFYTWFYRVMHNLTIDHLRKKSRRAGKSVSLEEKTEAIGDAVFTEVESDSPEDDMLHKEQREALSRALQELSEEHRDVFSLRELEGMSYLEIAERLEITKGTVMSRLYYARQRLMAELSGEHA